MYRFYKKIHTLVLWSRQIYSVIVVGMVIFLPRLLLAQTLNNPLRDVETIPELADKGLELTAAAGVIVLIFGYAYTGYLFVAARGDTAKIQTARTAFLWTTGGGGLLLGAEPIGNALCNTAKGLGADVECTP